MSNKKRKKILIVNIVGGGILLVLGLIYLLLYFGVIILTDKQRDIFEWIVLLIWATVLIYIYICNRKQEKSSEKGNRDN